MESKTTTATDVFGSQFISHRHRFVYFAVPKTGSGSLLQILRNQTDLLEVEEKYDFLNYPGYLKCAFVRNPWDRTLSCFLNKIKNDEGFENINFEKGVMRKFRKFNVFYAGMPFREFLNAIENIPDEIADGHFASQHCNIMMNGEILVDFLGRFENYAEDIQQLLSSLGMDSDIDLPRINVSVDRKPYAEYYDEEMRKTVQRRFRQDIDLLDYCF